ncbi:M43 family zinc metalloprotease [Emticicia sp.]|uniref:M43 family zinc metalloprotease n=1 Tax=Emticicia sp. TaxID=1930953 RepID=UPI0037519C65
MKKYCIIIILLLNFSSIAQKTNICANAACDSISKISHPELSLRKIKYEQVLEIYMKGQQNFRIAAEIIRIPVVVHVIHNQVSNAFLGTNISDEQVFSQIKVINEDYRRKIGTMGFNSNAIGADTEIEFFLANIDPDGKPSSGITRSFSSKTSFNIINDNDRLIMSNLSYWDSNKYLNIWVAPLSSGYIGYGEFPYAETVEGLETEATENLDGVYIDYTTFGKKTGTNTKGLYSFGRTTTHEIGHWLGLYHPWGDERCGTDYVADTPQSTGANSSAFCKDVFSTCAGTRTRNLIEDYMDYSPDSCMNIFTQGQKDRMRAALELSKRRRRVVNFAKFQLPPSSTLQAVIFPNPTISTNVQVQVLLPNFQDFEVKISDIFGREVYTESFSDLPSTIVTLKTKDLPAGNYFLTVTSNIQKVQKRLALF